MWFCMWGMVWKFNKLRLWVVVRRVVVEVDSWQEGIWVAQSGGVWKREQGLVLFQVLDHPVHKIVLGGNCSFRRPSHKAPQRIVVMIVN